MKTKVLTVLIGLTLAPTAAAQELATEPLLDESGDVYECEDPNEPLSSNSPEARKLENSDDPDKQGCAELRQQLDEQASSPVVNPSPGETLLSDRRQELQTRIQLLQSLLDLLRQQLALLRGQ